jgi:hypothetical protein
LKTNRVSELGSNSRILYLFIASFVLTLPSAFAAHSKIFTRTVDLGLVQSGLINYSNDSVMKIYFETNNLPAQIITRALKLGIETKYLDTLLVWISMSLSVAAISLPIYAFTKLFNLSLSISLIINNTPISATILGFPGLALWFFPWAGSSTYPDFRYYTSHTLGFLGLLVFLIVIGLLLNNVLTVSGVLAGLNIAVHPFYGFVSFLFWVMVFIGLAKDFKINQIIDKVIFISVGCLISSLSLLSSRKSQFENSSPSQDEMGSYLGNWDSHRSDDLSLNWKAFLLFLIAFEVLRRIVSSHPPLQSNLIFVVKGIQILNIVGLIAYSYHVFGAQKLHQNIFMQAQIGRLQLAIGYLLTPLILGALIYSISSNKQITLPWFWMQIRSIKSISTKELTLMCAILAIVTLLYNINDISKKNTTELNSSSKAFDCDTNLSGRHPLVLASESTSIPMFRICNFPIILDATSFDFIPYYPQTLVGVKKIIEIGYGLDFDSPTNNINCGCIPEVLHRSVWESRTEQDWLSIAQELKFSAIAAPAEWVIDVQRSVTVLPGIKLYVLRR